jgi:hypothetical protein
MRSVLFLFALLSMHPSFARADDPCPTVELDDNGQSAHGFPIWNQGATPACFAFSASFLASVWIRENWARANSSYENYISDPFSNFSAMSNDSVAYPQIEDADKGRTCQALDYIMKLEIARSGDPTHPLYSVPTCAMWGIDMNADGTHKIQQAPDAFLAKMHDLLAGSARPLPYGIEYCSAVFFNPEKDFIINRTYAPTLTYLNSIAASENFTSDCGFHSAAVIGQKMRSGVCYFKVRNSWGREGLFARNVERGNFWIPSEALARNTLRLIEMQAP